MNKIKHTLIGLALIGLTGNASAVMIGNGTNIHYNDTYDLIQAVKSGAYSDNYSRFSKKITRKDDRIGEVSARLDRGKADKSLNKTQKSNIKYNIRKKEHKIVKLLNRMGFFKTASALPVEGNPGGSQGYVEDDRGNTGGNGGNTGGTITDNGNTSNIPEPSTIALLGLGLLGIGAARRFKKM